MFLNYDACMSLKCALLLWDFCVCLLFCYALLCFHSSFAIILKRKRKLVALLLLSYRKKYYVAIPRGAVGWSALCDCGIS